jgi:hypothetical protein
MRWSFAAIVILGLGLSVYLTAYGISAGLLNKRILNDGWRKTYDTGAPAVQRGWFYIVLGIILVVIFVAGLVRLWGGG